MKHSDENDEGVHLTHCYQGEYPDTCKYGEENCPAKPKYEARPRYKIGNVLRGFFYYHATNDEEAWEIGQAIFNSHYPSESGRKVFMDRADLPSLREGYTKVSDNDDAVAEANTHTWLSV